MLRRARSKRRPSMLNPRWRKGLRDLWHSKMRTLLVVLSIAVGVFAVGMVAGSRSTMLRGTAQAYAAASAASATLYVEPFEDELVQVVRHMPEIREAEGRRSLTVRMKVGSDEWRNLQLFAIPDYHDIRINKVYP